jgi:hypothetical protein
MLKRMPVSLLFLTVVSVYAQNSKPMNLRDVLLAERITWFSGIVRTF